MKERYVIDTNVLIAASASDPTNERRFEYEVRPLFQASMSCERENAQAACMPLRPVMLDFLASAPCRLF